MKIKELMIKDEMNFLEIDFATKEETEEFKKEIFDVDEIFKFLNCPNRVCKYVNIIASISLWGKILHSFKVDFELPLFFYWHYFRKGESIVYDDDIKKANGDPVIEKFKDVFVKQFYVALMSFLDKLKHAYANIYNFSYGNFKKRDFTLTDDVLLKSGLLEELRENLQNIICFETCLEFEKFRKLRNSSVHNIGGKRSQLILVAQNPKDYFREMTFTKENITDRQLLDLLKIILPKLDDLCTEFNTINLKFYLYLIKFDMPGEIVNI